MAIFILRRLAWGLLVIWAVATFVFFAVHATGDPIADGLRETGASEERIQQVLAELGYDRPLLEQYVDFLFRLLQGDFGRSLRFGSSAAVLIFERMPATLFLAVVALVFTIVTAVPLGMLAAHKPGGPADRIASALSTFGQAVPNFVIGPLLILLFAVQLGWLPVSGYGQATSVVLPAMTLALYPIARVTRVMRSTAARVMTSDYVDNARAKGLAEPRVLWVHVFKNALISVVTLLGLELAGLVGGAVIVETIFSWPGIGSLVIQSFAFSDFPVGQALVIIIAAMVVTIMLATDIAYSFIDPRIGVGQ